MGHRVIFEPGKVGGKDISHEDTSEKAFPQPQPVGADSLHGPSPCLPDKVACPAETGPGGEKEKDSAGSFSANEVFFCTVGASSGFQTYSKAEDQICNY